MDTVTHLENAEEEEEEPYSVQFVPVTVAAPIVGLLKMLSVVEGPEMINL